jgi:uncharacterized C2H2 Zn-finger protein
MELSEDALSSKLVAAVRSRLEREGGSPVVLSVIGGLLGQDPALAEQMRKRWGNFAAFLNGRPEFSVGLDESNRVTVSLVRRKAQAATNKKGSNVPTPASSSGKQQKDKAVPTLFSCDACGVEFAAKKSLAQHVSMKHGKKEQPQIATTVEKQAAPKVRAGTTTNGVSCTTCGANFATKKALHQHTSSKHAKTQTVKAVMQQQAQPLTKQVRRRSMQLESLEPPFGTAKGEWMAREDFPYDKSFGWFECGSCFKRWSSAHAYKEFEQGCQKCEIYWLPKFMWLNDDDRSSDTNDGDESSREDGPHDQARCEACKRGRCIAGKEFESQRTHIAVHYVTDSYPYDDYYD